MLIRECHLSRWRRWTADRGAMCAVPPENATAVSWGRNGIILLHILAYYVFDRKTIGCVDFFGLATFLGIGQVTAGTVFLALLRVCQDFCVTDPSCLLA